MQHRIKTNPESLDAIRRGLKKCTLRRDDRGYEVADALVLLDLDGRDSGVVAQVTHVERYPVALKKNYVALSISLISPLCP